MGRQENLETNIRLKVLPGASRNEIVGWENGVFKVKLTAPPVEGRANKALKTLLAKRLGLPRRNVEIVSGMQSRMKIVRLQGTSLEEAKNKLGEGRL